MSTTVRYLLITSLFSFHFPSLFHFPSPFHFLLWLHSLAIKMLPHGQTFPASPEALERATCPSCSSFFNSPINECHNGHCICGKCYDRLELKYCPFCSISLAFCRRNQDLEQLISTRTARCPFSLCGREIILRAKLRRPSERVRWSVVLAGGKRNFKVR